MLTASPLVGTFVPPPRTPVTGGTGHMPGTRLLAEPAPARRVCGAGSRAVTHGQGPAAWPGPLPGSGAARGTRPPGKGSAARHIPGTSPALQRASRGSRAGHGQNSPKSRPCCSTPLAVRSRFLGRGGGLGLSLTKCPGAEAKLLCPVRASPSSSSRFLWAVFPCLHLSQ